MTWKLPGLCRSKGCHFAAASWSGWCSGDLGWSERLAAVAAGGVAESDQGTGGWSGP